MSWTPPAPAVNGTTLYDAARDSKLVAAITDLYGITAGISSGGGKPPFVVVASNDAPSSAKATADFVCTGTADQVQIQSAVDLAAPLVSRNSTSPSGAAQRGQVFLTGGRFVCSAPVQVRTGVHITGCGVLSEVLCSGNNGTGAFTLANPTDHLTRLSNFQINGNGTAGGTCNGIDFDMSSGTDTSGYPGVNPDAYHYITDMVLLNFTGGTRTGIKVWASGTANNRGNVISRCTVRNVSGNCYWFSATSDCLISDCDGGTATGTGFLIAGGNTAISGCKAFYANGWGFDFSSGRALAATLTSQDNASGIHINSADSTFANLGVDTCSAAGIQISAANVSLSGFNIFVRSGGRYTTQANGLLIDGTYADNVIVGSIGGANITTPFSGSAGARNFWAVPDGTTLHRAG